MRVRLSLAILAAVTSIGACSLTTSLEGLAGAPVDVEGGLAADAADGETDVRDSGLADGDASVDPVAEGLIGSWRFDEAPGLLAKDTSGKGNDGVLTGGVTRTPGKVGQALSFNGTTSYVLVPASSSLIPTSTMSVTLWLQASSLSVTSSPRLLTRDGAWDIKLNAGNLQLSSGPTYAISDAVVGTKAWRHVAVVFDRGVVTIYVDGAPTGLATNTFKGGEILADGMRDLYIGAHGANDAVLDGLIDELRIYDRVLTPAEIQTLAR
jgi:hypothetical protein